MVWKGWGVWKWWCGVERVGCVEMVVWDGKGEMGWKGCGVWIGWDGVEQVERGVFVS